VARYFFDTYDGHFLARDDLGQELESLESAKAVAQKALPEMARDELTDGDQRVFMVSVRDASDQVVMRLALTMVVEYPPRASDLGGAISQKPVHQTG
jgi:hypothetical protein